MKRWFMNYWAIILMVVGIIIITGAFLVGFALISGYGNEPSDNAIPIGDVAITIGVIAFGVILFFIGYAKR
jgi:hypothetical protein